MNRYLAIALLLTSFSAYGALHKWIDDQGKVHYSDTMPDSGVKAKTLKSSATAPDSVTTSSSGETAPKTGETAPKTMAERDAEVRKSQKAKSDADAKAASEQEKASYKKQNCENARTSLAGLINTPRLVVYNEQGEPTYLDDEARNRHIEEARKVVSNACN